MTHYASWNNANGQISVFSEKNIAANTTSHCALLVKKWQA